MYNFCITKISKFETVFDFLKSRFDRYSLYDLDFQGFLNLGGGSAGECNFNMNESGSRTTSGLFYKARRI